MILFITKKHMLYKIRDIKNTNFLKYAFQNNNNNWERNYKKCNFGQKSFDIKKDSLIQKYF